MLTLTLSALVLLHVPYLNGADHWQWEWRRVPAVRWYSVMLLCAVPVAGAVLLRRYRKSLLISLLLLMLGSLTMKLGSAAALSPPLGAEHIEQIVRSREATSYFIDAAALSNYPGWFAAYDEVLPNTGLHTRSKPPGPLLYWTIFVQALGYNERAAIAGGVLLAVLATLSVPATWWVVRLLSGDGDAGFIAAVLLALCPGCVLFFPMFDPIYIVLSCAMIGVWHLTVTRDTYILAGAFGTVLFTVTMIAYPLLALGLFMLLFGLLGPPRAFSRNLLVTVRQGAIALVVVTFAYLTLWFFTSYDPIATFDAAWHNQHRFLAQHESERVWPATILWDLADFALGAAWLPAIVAVMYLFRTMRTDDPARGQRALVTLCLLQPLVVALTGLVQSETARVWAFMLPLLLLPAALELRRWSVRERLTFYACMLVLLLVVGQNMTFLNPG